MGHLLSVFLGIVNSAENENGPRFLHGRPFLCAEYIPVDYLCVYVGLGGGGGGGGGPPGGCGFPPIDYWISLLLGDS